MTPFEAGYVTRWHTWPRIRPQTNADHAHGVAVAVQSLAGPDITPELYRAALHHDHGEYWCGDMRYTFKRVYPDFAAILEAVEERAREKIGIKPFNLTAREKIILKMADRIEPLQYLGLWHPELLKHEDFVGEPKAIAQTGEGIGISADVVMAILSGKRPHYD